MTGLWLFSYIALWLLFLVTAVVLLLTLRNIGVVHESLAASRQSASAPPRETKLSAGSILPELNLQLLGGGERRVSDFRGAKTAFMVVSPSCGPCHTFLHDVAAGKRPIDPLDPGVQRVVAVSTGDAAATTRLAAQVKLPINFPILIDDEHDVARQWGITTTPATVIVDDRSRVVRQVFGVNTVVAEEGGV